MYESDQGCVPMHYGCIAYCSSGTPKIKTTEVSDTCVLFSDTFPSTGLPPPVLIGEAGSYLIVTWHSMFS